ncbi:MAG: dTDP-4-dehydrorhamnose 3,5-epimerase [Proteobacteria bacterium]|nr:dTDP-4-dehydrorhamnose 3,5-epimerase [Pseudomonadota bacterium]NDG25831.1 dTDP-4-dehydrorhamnose 3,5-epimerase [Pseudomonadota bacterium]
MELVKTDLPEVLLIKPQAHQDARGFFLESWQKQRYEAFGIKDSWAQDNVSCSSHGVLRGLHFQFPRMQGKLITVLQGEIFDVAVDIRRGSPSFGKSVSVRLSSDNLHQLWVPKGFAHGFIVTSSTAIVSYKASEFYYPEDERSLLWNDPQLNIPWPTEATPLVSAKDKAGKRLADIAPSSLPLFEP